MNIEKRIEKISQAYSQNLVARAFVNAIPYIGSSLDLVFSEKWNKISNIRTQMFFDFIKDELEKIDEAKINQSFIESDDFADLTVKCLELSSRSRKQEKIKMIAKILTNAIITGKFDIEEFEEIKYIIDQISLREITFLSHLETLEDELKNNYIQMLERSNKRGIINGVNAPKFSSFYDAFLSDLFNKYKINKEDADYLLRTCTIKGLLIDDRIDYSKNTPIKSGHESFSHTMPMQLSNFYFIFKKYILVELSELKNCIK